MITAHHEAGHAVASTICGGTVYKIDIDGGHDTAGRSVSADCSLWLPYTIYGGVWAEARLRYRSTDPHFRKEIRRVFAEQRHGDKKTYQAAVRATGIRREPKWDVELEVFWPVTQRVAALLLAGVYDVESQLPALAERAGLL